MIARSLGALICLFLSLTVSAYAATVKTELVEGTLVPEHETVAPGERTVIALDMTIESGWHTYWKNAGDSGQAVEVKWTAPEGVTFGETDWPAPHRQPFPPLMNYGYSDAATLLMPVTIPADWPQGKPVDLKAEVYWLVCNDVCIPEQGETSLTLKTASASRLDTERSGLFVEARAALARDNPYPSRHEIDGDLIELRVDSAAFAEAEIEDVYFFPSDWGVIDHAATQVASIDAEGLTLAVPRSPETDELPKTPLSGILEITEKSPSGPLRMALAVDAERGVVTTGAGSYRGAADAGPGFATILFFALIGGTILNLMPCVFPVLALKAIGLAGSAGQSRKRAVHGFAYTAGVLSLFALLAAGFLALKSAGMAIGWGFQLQNPFIVAGLAYLLFLVGLNLSGVFEVTSQFAGIGSGQARKDGPFGAFFTGALAAVVATPCTAPFMATAMGATLTMSAPSTMAVFLMLGFGLALPFLILSLAPATARLLPAPGPWMTRFKEALAFPMYASAAWLVWVLGALSGPDAVLKALIGGVFLGLAAWAFGVGQNNSGGRLQTLSFGTAVASLGVALALATQMQALPQRGDGRAIEVRGPDEPFSVQRLQELRAEGKPVFLNMTADWCITCKVNEKVALGGDFERALTDNGVTYLKGDWTARDPEITALLETFGRAGVPLYAVYPRSGEPRLLPQFLTSDMIVDALGGT